MGPMSRFLHSHTPLSSAAATAVEEKPEDSTVMATIEKYGLFPFLSLGAITILSKEMFVVDAEFLLATDIALFVGVCYVGVGDQMNKYFENQIEDEQKKLHA